MAYIRKTTELIISDDLREVLEAIQDSSVVAKMLLKKRTSFEDLNDDYVDYLSISHSDTTKMSYLNEDRIKHLQEVNECLWTSSRRFHARPGSVVQKIFKGLSGRDVEIFNNLYKSYLTRVKFQFKIVDGEDIRRYYYADTYLQNSGSLGASCMKYENCQKYLNLYVENKDIVTMLVMVDSNNQLIGRALLWNFDGEKVMDRIYTMNDEEFQYHFKKWAIDNGYVYKHEQRWNSTLTFESNGEKQEKRLAIKLARFDYSKYPYMDTFKFLDRRNGVMYNYIPESVDFKTLCAPDGSYYDSDYLVHDFFSNIYIHRGDSVVIGYVNGALLPDSTYRTQPNNCYYSECNSCYILTKDAIYDESLDDYMFNADLDHLNNKTGIDDRRASIKRRDEAREERERERAAQMTLMLERQRRESIEWGEEPIHATDTAVASDTEVTGTRRGIPAYILY